MKLNFRSLTTVLVGAALLAELSSASQFGISKRTGRVTTDTSSRRQHPNLTKASWTAVPRGGDSAPPTVGDASGSGSAGDLVVSAVKGLTSYMEGPKADTLLLLLTTALNTPICKMLGTSPILGFLALGVLFGPNGFSLIKDIHTTESALGCCHGSLRCCLLL